MDFSLRLAFIVHGTSHDGLHDMLRWGKYLVLFVDLYFQQYSSLGRDMWGSEYMKSTVRNHPVDLIVMTSFNGLDYIVGVPVHDMLQWGSDHAQFMDLYISYCIQTPS